MDAGRELDALVAEKVMGYRLLWAHKVWSTDDWLSSDRPTEQNTMAIVTDENWAPGKSYPKYLVIPQYSTDIAAAWLVVEELSAKYSVSVHHFLGRRWQCTLERRDGRIRMPIEVSHDGDAFANADSAPLAICLAALKACGVEV